MKNKHLSKAISKAQWYKSRLFLTHQCEKLGIELRLAPRFYPSSKLCSCCGYKNTELKLKDRTWTCPKCSVVHDREIPCRVSSDLHEWSNDFPTVSTMNSVQQQLL